MKIEIIGSRCATCKRYTQYYRLNAQMKFEAIDCGYCGEKSRNVRPWDRCSGDMEKSNVGMPIPVCRVSST